MQEDEDLVSDKEEDEGKDADEEELSSEAGVAGGVQDHLPR